VTDADPVEFVLRLHPLPDAIPPIVRLRRAMKLLLRSFRLKCTAVALPDGTAPRSPLTKRRPQK
jgi:hypothetical protein